MTIEHIAIRPGDADYDAARTTIAGTAEPAVVVRPTTPEEVAASIRHARAEGLPLAVRSGGHNALGFGNINGGAVLDLSRLDQVELLGDGRVRIGAGATWGPAAQALAEHGLAITSGDTTSVGVGGLAQAGGIGWMVRKHGLTIDSLLAAEVVTAGNVVRASATENAELFWAMRGGAGNFGVVTAFEFQAQPVTTVHYGALTFALDDVAQLLKGWTAAMRSAPDELTTTLVLMPGFGDFPAGAILYVCLAGEDTAALEPLRGIGTVVAEDVSERPYAEVLEGRTRRRACCRSSATHWSSPWMSRSSTRSRRRTPRAGGWCSCAASVAPSAGWTPRRPRSPIARSVTRALGLTRDSSAPTHPTTSPRSGPPRPWNAASGQAHLGSREHLPP